MTFEQAREIISKDHAKGMWRAGMVEGSAIAEWTIHSRLKGDSTLLVLQMADDKSDYSIISITDEDIAATDWKIVDLLSHHS